MNGKRWRILPLGIVLVLLVSTVGVTRSSFIDLETSTANTLQAWSDNLWTQTSQVDFEAGVVNQVDTASIPGDVKLDDDTWESYSSELLVNPGAETGNTTGWTAVGPNSANFVAGSDCPSGSAGCHSGSYCFYWNNPSASDDWAYQEVDLNAYLSSIQAGEAQVRAGGWLVCSEYHVPVWDIVRLRVVLYDSSHAEIGTIYDTGELNIQNWTEYLVEDYTLPTNTNYLRVYFQTYEPFWDAGNADDLTVKVRVKEQAWYDSDWSYRRQITIDHTSVEDVADPSTTYAEFPVLVYATGLSNILPNGADIRFTSSDGVTELPREIESYTGGTLYAWVKLTLTKDASDSTNDIIYMYYGNVLATEPAPDSTYGSENVWDSNFDGSAYER